MDDDPTVVELTRLLAETANQDVKKFLQKQINIRISALAKEKAAQKAKPQMMDLAALGIKMPPKKDDGPRKPPAGKALKISSYSWEETDERLKFRINNISGFENTEENLKNVFVDIQRCTIAITVHHRGCNYSLEIDNLSGDMVVQPNKGATPTIKIKPSYIFISMAKDYPKTKWHFLTEEERETHEAKQAKRKEAHESYQDDGLSIHDKMKKQMETVYAESDDEGKRKLNEILEKAKQARTKDPAALGQAMKDYMAEHEKKIREKKIQI